MVKSLRGVLARLLSLVLLAGGACPTLPGQIQIPIDRRQRAEDGKQKSQPTARLGGDQVFAFHAQATEIGRRVLDSGGNAFDAFVAVVVADNVLAEGASSLDGALGALLFVAKTRKVVYLDADFNDPRDPEAAWSPSDPKPGGAVLVPGTVAGLEAIATRYGSRPLAKLVEPAIALARDGFDVDAKFVTFLTAREGVLKRTEYGRRTFFRDGNTLEPGTRLRQPEVASFLSHLASEGSAYVYKGAWAEKFLATVRENGGRLTAADLASYRPLWQEPWWGSYRGHKVYSSSGRQYGGPWVLMALKTLEHTTLANRVHYTRSAEGLSLVVRTARGVWAEPWLFDYRVLDDHQLVQSRIQSSYADRIWDRVATKVEPTVRRKTGTHSYHVIVVDRHGNAVSGTHTHQSEPWGEGLFVEGIPLTSAGRIQPWYTQPGERRLSPLSIHLTFHAGRVRFLTGAISNSVVEAEFQNLVNLIDYGLAPTRALSMPRFGTFPVADTATHPLGLDLEQNWLDPRIGPELVARLRDQGLKFQQLGVVDTGLGVVAAIDPRGQISGAVSVLPGFEPPNRSLPLNSRSR